MMQKLAVRSGIFVAILAQSATLLGCGTEDGQEAAAGDGDGDSGGDGDGDGDASGDGDGDVSGDGDDCEDLLAYPPPLVVFVTGGASEDGETCRVEASASFDGERNSLECVVAGQDCHCYPVTYGAGFEPGMTLEVFDGETVLFTAEALHEQPSENPCSGARYGDFHVDYVEALGAARASLRASVESTASPESCETEAECEALPLGAKACGGPWGYVVVSNQSASYEETVALAEELERIERLYNVASELSSDCAYEVPPEVSCDGGVCIGAPAQ